MFALYLEIENEMQLTMFAQSAELRFEIVNSDLALLKIWIFRLSNPSLYQFKPNGNPRERLSDMARFRRTCTPASVGVQKIPDSH